MLDLISIQKSSKWRLQVKNLLGFTKVLLFFLLDLVDGGFFFFS